jgi:hypothetical protein
VASEVEERMSMTKQDLDEFYNPSDLRNDPDFHRWANEQDAETRAALDQEEPGIFDLARSAAINSARVSILGGDQTGHIITSCAASWATFRLLYLALDAEEDVQLIANIFYIAFYAELEREIERRTAAALPVAVGH